MNLNGKQIVEQGIITKVVNDNCIQQVGVDLELIKVEQVLGGGFIPKEGKTQLAARIEVKPEDQPNGTQLWFLEPGVYDITMAQGCKIPANQRLRIVQRSSFLRNGAILSSSMFDPGFETENIGTILHVKLPMVIEVGARVGQAYVSTVNAVGEDYMYNGQFQQDKQRDDQGADV
jgi:deoxycytidine triphosphate deaminase